jgi:hypothetical protein
MEAGDPYFATAQRLQWHPAVHEEVGHETLHYWFLTFSTSYEWDVLRAELLALLESHQVHSFALYELMGDCDVLLRVWLPRGTSGSFRVSLQHRLERFSLSKDVLCSVEKVIRHWPFSVGGKGDIQTLSGDAANPHAEVIEQVNEKLLAGVDATDPTLAALADDGTVGPQNHSEDQISGVKIVTLIKPMGELSNAQKRGLEKRLALVLDEQEVVRQRSLYQVDGAGSVFLLTCLVPEADFFSFRENLVGDLAPLLEAAGARTNSYSCASRDLLMFQDVIPPPGARRVPVRPRFRCVADLLKLEESITLEVKGSAFAPLDPWLFEGEQLIESQSFFHRGILHAIVGFLNADGGSIVIGGLERQRYRHLSEAPPPENRPEFKEIGGYLCAGLLDPYYYKRGWDPYERKMAQAIASNVTPDPSPLLSIRNEEAEGITFCVIDVGPGQEAGWHYLKPQGEDGGAQFLVRQGARTVALDGVDADRYKGMRG